MKYAKRAATYFIIALLISGAVYVINRNIEASLFVFNLLMFLLAVVLDIDARTRWSKAFSALAFLSFMLSFFYKPAECTIIGLSCLIVACMVEAWRDKPVIKEVWVIVRPVVFWTIIALVAVIVSWLVFK